jgi:hypothetical protein
MFELQSAETPRSQKPEKTSGRNRMKKCFGIVFDANDIGIDPDEKCFGNSLDYFPKAFCVGAYLRSTVFEKSATLLF